MDFFPPSALALTAIEVGSAARPAEVPGGHKYEGLSFRYIVQVIAVQSSGCDW